MVHKVLIDSVIVFLFEFVEFSKLFKCPLQLNACEGTQFFASTVQ